MLVKDLIAILSKCDKEQRVCIYENMCKHFPEYEEHYREYLL